MKALFFSDLHAHNWEQFSTKLSSGRNSRLQDCLNVVKHAEGICKHQEIDACFFLGDVFHSRVKIDVDVFSSTYLAFEELARSVNALYILVGNHDQYSKVGEVHSLEPFKRFATVVDSPHICSFRCGTKIALHPHTKDIESLKTWVASLLDAQVLCIHQGVREGAVGPYHQQVNGELSLTDLHLEKFKYVIAGDYHKRQFIQNFHYVGSPLQLTFAERGEEKAFTVLEATQGHIGLSYIPSLAPRFFICEYGEGIPSIADPARDFIRMQVPKSKLDAAQALKNGYANLQIEAMSEAPKVLSRINAEAASSDRELLKSYISQREQGLDYDILLDLGLSLLQESDDAQDLST